MSSNLSVLVVDDDPMCLQMLQAILEEAGLRVTTADRPKLALSCLQSHTPDILVTDLRMPEMSGLDVMRAAHAVDREIPCLVITALYLIGVRKTENRQSIEELERQLAER